MHKQSRWGWYRLLGIGLGLLVLVAQPVSPLAAQLGETDNRTVDIAWTSDESKLALGSRQGLVYIVDATTQEVLQEFTAYSTDVAGLAWSPAGDRLVTGGYYDATIKIWDLNTMTLEHTIPTPAGTVIFSVAWSPDGEAIVVAQRTGDANVTIWNPATGEMIYAANSGTGTDIAWNSDASLFAVTYFLPYIEIRDAQTFELVSFVGLSPASIPRDVWNSTLYVNWHPDGTYLISGAVAGEVTVWDVATGEAVYALSAPLTTDQDAQRLYAREVWFSPDGRTFSSVAIDGTYRTWETATGKPLQMVQLDDTIRVAAISPTRTKLAYAGPANELVIKHLPYADAGPDQTLTDTDGNGLEPVVLDGTVSFDQDGAIVRYDWQLDGAIIAVGPRLQVAMPLGQHKIMLLVTDNDGLVAADEVLITVQ